jgi:porphobilinogen synthase
MFFRRPRRNRKSDAIRSMIRETQLLPQDLIHSFFVLEGENRREAVATMPRVDRLSIDLLIEESKRLMDRGIRSVILFPVIEKEKKDETGGEAVRPDNLLYQAIRELKKALPSLCVIADIALDPYTTHGHDGVVDGKGEVLNDETVVLLGSMAVMAARAGVDIVAPSDMMDGRVGYIRRSLDDAGFYNVSILAYTAKYASAFYGPFRDALSSSPKSGDKKGYQMDPANRREAVLECALDLEEGADMVMVKPALLYLDVICQIRSVSSLPVAAFHVSGEYSMIMAAGERGWLDISQALWESHLAIKRAGADMILTYASHILLDHTPDCT